MRPFHVRYFGRLPEAADNQLSLLVQELKDGSHSAVLRASALLPIELCTLKLTASER